MKIYSYSNGSKGANLLAEALKVKLIARQNSRFKGGKDKVVINWGASVLPEAVEASDVYNVNSWIASSKLTTFEHIKDKEYCPSFCTSKEDAIKMFDKKGAVVVCRTILNGHSGNGIIIADKPEALVDAPLYVLYIPKKEEYRVHVAFGKAIHLQRKARSKDVPDEKVNWKVRNHANGFIFQQEGVECSPQVINAAIDAVEACKLDFGAVDVVWNDKNQKAYVLEINTAPGIEGTTVEKYKEAFKVLMG